jgi:hypothetical protein
VDVLLEGPVATGSGGAWTADEVTGELRGVASGSRGLRLLARPAPTDRTLRVKVVDPAGEPVEGAQVQLDMAFDGLSRVGTTDASGVATFEGLTARARAVGAVGNGRAGNLAPVVPSGQEVVVRLE